MCWVLTDFASAAFGVAGGHVRLINPELQAETLDLPQLAFPVNQRASLAPYIYGDKSRMFIAGGLSDTCMVTEDRVLLRCFITPTERELVLSATPASYQIGLEAVGGSTGPTGLVNWFIRWRDPINGRRSPFSAMSPTMTLNGSQAVRFYNLPLRPTPDDYGVSQIEFWANINGTTDSRGRLAISLIATRDSGATTVTITETAETEVEIEQGLQAVPRGTFNVIYHNRRWWNDPKNPNRVCFSPLDRPDEWGGGFRTTRNGEAVTGLFVVRDTLCIFAGMASYRLNGYTEDDFNVSLLDPGLGCVTHFGLQLIGQVGLVPTREGLALCTGNSLRLIPSDYQRLWATQCSANRVEFEGGYGINDTIGKVYKFWDGRRFWVLDYDAFGLTAESSPPLLSFDDHALTPLCSAMLAVPGARTAACFTAYSGGLICEDNIWGSLDAAGSFDAIIVPAPPAMESGGGPWDGLQLNDFWLFMSNMGLSPDTYSLEILFGNEFAMLGNGGFVFQDYETVGVLLSIVCPRPEDSHTISTIAPFGQSNGFGDKWFSQTFKWGNLGLQAEGFTPRIVVTNPTHLIYRGFGMTLQPGSKAAAIRLNTGG